METQETMHGLQELIVQGPRILTPQEMLGFVKPAEMAGFSDGRHHGVPDGWDTIRVKLSWLSPILGTTPADSKSLVSWRELAKSKGDRKGIEVFDVDEGSGKVTPVAVEDGVSVELNESQQGHTAFWKDADGKPCIMAFQLRGFLLNATAVMKGDKHLKFPGRMAGKDADPARVVRNNTKILPYAVPIADKITGVFGRPVRAMTMSGPRISINVSEVVAEPWAAEFVIAYRADSGLTPDVYRFLLEYGEVEGISQWRSGGWGRFAFKVVE